MKNYNASWACFPFINALKVCINVVTATCIWFSTLSIDQYLDFNTVTAENPASLKYDVANGINIRETLLAISRYSS